MLQEVVCYEQVQDTFAVLKMLALGNRQIPPARVKPAAGVGTRLRRDVAVD